MALVDELKAYVKDTFGKNWSTSIGQVVPEPKNLNAGNSAIEFDRATVLYADLSGSTNMVNSQNWTFAAEIYKSFLYCSARLISDNGGSITAYDGDRVMGLFVGGSQSVPAVKCALKINYAAKSVIAPALKQQYPQSGFVLRHVVGIDTSPIRVAKTGVRGDNDLVWVGRSANYAAKLTELSSDHASWITGDVYNRLDDSTKFGGDPKRSMWEKMSWTQMGGLEIYRSNWHWPF